MFYNRCREEAWSAGPHLGPHAALGPGLAAPHHAPHLGHGAAEVGPAAHRK